MKKLIVVLMSVALVVGALIPLQPQNLEASTIRILMDGEPMTLEVPPVVRAGRVLVPFRALFEAFGATVGWTAATETVTGQLGTTTVSLRLNRPEAVVNERTVRLDVVPVVLNGRTLVPLRFVAENLGADVRWEERTQTVTVVRPVATRPAHVFRLVEADGTELVLAEIPRRVVALSVNTAGVLASMGIMPVGMANTTRAPHTLRDVPQLGSPMSPDIERLRAVRPDLVIANILFKPRLAPIFRQHGLTAYFIDNQRYSDVIANLEMFGRAFFNNSNHAQALIDHIRGRERAALAAVQGRPQPRVLIIFGTPQAFMLSTQYSYVGEMVKMLGGRNVTEGMTVARHTQQIPLSMENIITFNPEIILRISHGSPEQVARMFAAEFAQNPVWGRMDAVRNGRVIDLPPALFMSNPGLPMIDAFEALARFMYP